LVDVVLNLFLTAITVDTFLAEGFLPLCDVYTVLALAATAFAIVEGENDHPPVEGGLLVLVFCWGRVTSVVRQTGCDNPLIRLGPP